MPASAPNPFDSISGDLLPEFREQYVQGHLGPEVAQRIEAYLASSPIQANIILGRAQALLVAHQAEGQVFTPPRWVQEQLRYQPTVSAVGPLRRRVVQLALGLFLLLIGASVVQWLRNEPLVPAPVARAVARAASSASQATHELVQRLTAPRASTPTVAVRKPAVRLVPAPAPRPAPLALIQTRVAQLAVAESQHIDSLMPTRPAAVEPATTAATEVSTVHGRITDGQGRPLPGATVLVQGTRQATSADATGNYELTVPAGSVLQFGYGGYVDQLQRCSAASTMNVELQHSAPEGRHRR